MSETIKAVRFHCRFCKERAGLLSDPRGPDSSRDDLAYQAALRMLQMQDASLTNLRNRASGLLTISTLITSFTATLGWLNGGHVEGWYLVTLTSLLLATLVTIGFLVIVILKPRLWYFCPSAEDFLNPLQQESADETRAAVTRKMIQKSGRNREILYRLSRLYKFGLYFLLVEVGLVVWISFIPKPKGP
ncbi:hypothetical protein ABZW30_30070 [Kitasatospora sp. NPDC004669]|uniref:hypothetical protein n=1 Tax=Kitasatospora sp. NPDC004669 TaxID=3154555 RepID=UPI0033A7795D